MTYEIDEVQVPKVISPYTLAVALIVHLVFFTLLALIAFIHFRPQKLPDVMEVTVIVNENLDGVDNEPPPLNDPPKPEPPKPEPPKPKVEEPPKVEEIKQEVVQVIKEKPKPEPPKPKAEEKKPEPPKEEKKPEKPKETMEERMKRMRESATESKKPVKIQVKDKPSGNGKTQRQNMTEAQIRALLNQGYRPGTSNQLATSDLQLGVSLVKMALDDKWAALRPSIGAPGVVVLSVKIAASGRLTDVRLVKSCGSPLSDKAALMVAKQVGVVHNLPQEFINKFRNESLTIRYNVTAQ